MLSIGRIQNSDYVRAFQGHHLAAVKEPHSIRFYESLCAGTPKPAQEH